LAELLVIAIRWLARLARYLTGYLAASRASINDVHSGASIVFFWARIFALADK
jgi:hypothetical protein